MTHFDSGDYAGKHGKDRPLASHIADAVKAKVSGGLLSCEAAFQIAEELEAAPAEVGRCLDMLEIKISRCQLGLFGHAEGKRLVVEPAESVSPELEEAVREGLVNGRLPCSAAWGIAGKFGLAKTGVTAACEKLGIRIKPCQLGSF